MYEQNVKEYWFEEGCFIQEIANDSGDEDVSIARVRVPGGSKTLFHALEGVTERYIIISGRGRMELGELVGLVCCGESNGGSGVLRW